MNNSADIRNAGTYTIRMSSWNDFETCVEREVTIQKRELTIASDRIMNKSYDGANEVLTDGVVFENVAEGEEVFDIVQGDVVVSGSDAGYYSTVTGLEAVEPFTSYIERYHGDNYINISLMRDITVNEDLTAENLRE